MTTAATNVTISRLEAGWRAIAELEMLVGQELLDPNAARQPAIRGGDQ
jgi:hypothetical protein